MLALIVPVLLLGGAAGAPTLQESRLAAAAPGDSMLSRVKRLFELYAPTEDDLGFANGEILTAISSFNRHIGDSPEKMAFVLFRSAAEADRYDYSRLTMRGMRVLPWVVAASPPGGRVTGAGEEAGNDNPDPLSHEAGHSFLNAYVERQLAKVREAGASATDPAGASAVLSSPTAGSSGRGSVVTERHPGHPILPDWLDEAVAALGEPQTLQFRRIEFMRAHLDRRIPFAELLTMRQPMAGEPGGPKSGPRKAARSGGAQGAPPGAERAAIFTAEALSLARFIAQSEHERFIGTIVEGVIRGRTVGEVLNTSQGIYSKPEPLEKQWLEWMKDPSRAP